MDTLREPGFSVKLRYTLKKVFAPGDPSRIDYDYTGISYIATTIYKHINDSILLGYVCNNFMCEQCVVKGILVNSVLILAIV